MTQVLVECVREGVRAQCALLTAGVAWDDAERVAGDVCALVREQLAGFFDALYGLYDGIMPTAVKPRVFGALVAAFAACVDDFLGRLCATLCTQERPHQGAAYETLQAATALARAVEARAGLALDVPAATGLLLLWVKNNGPTLAAWVERAISVDKRVPLQAGLLHSSSVVDVSEACAQVIAQMKELVIPDIFLWPQAGELLLGAMQHYFELQQRRAEATIRKHGAALFAEERALQKACIAVANIEKGQELVDTVISSVEEGMDAWRAAHTDAASAARADISSQTLATNVAAVLKAAQAAIAAPVRLLADVLCAPVAAAADAALAAPAGLTDDAVARITARFDDAMVQAHARLSPRAFRALLAACWTRACDALGRSLAPDLECNGPRRGMSVPTVRDSFGRALAALYDYFSPDEGLSRAQLDTCRPYLRARRLVCLYQQSTESLIALTRGFDARPRRLPAAADPRLDGTPQADIEAVIRTRTAEGDLWARAFARERAGSDNSQAVRDHFSLPPSELLLDRWVCSSARRTGTLYLMSRHLCFDSAFTKNLSDTNGLVVMLEDIRALDECPIMLLFKGIRVAIDGVSDEETPVFSRFVAKVPDVIAAIRAQALLVNNKHLAAPATSEDGTTDGAPDAAAADAPAAAADAPNGGDAPSGGDEKAAADAAPADAPVASEDKQ